MDETENVFRGADGIAATVPVLVTEAHNDKLSRQSFVPRDLHRPRRSLAAFPRPWTGLRHVSMTQGSSSDTKAKLFQTTFQNLPVTLKSLVTTMPPKSLATTMPPKLLSRNGDARHTINKPTRTERNKSDGNIPFHIPLSHTPAHTPHIPPYVYTYLLTYLLTYPHTYPLTYPQPALKETLSVKYRTNQERIKNESREHIKNESRTKQERIKNKSKSNQEQIKR